MDAVTKFAPLAFSLSIHSEKTEASLAANAVDPSNSLIFAIACAGAAAAAAAGGLYIFLPAWLSIPVGLWAGYKSLPPFRRYFDNDYPAARIQANRELLGSIIDQEDVQRFAGVVQGVVSTEFAKRKWALRANEILKLAAPDYLLYLATVFTFAPECWRQCARSVYALHLKAAPTLVELPTT